MSCCIEKIVYFLPENVVTNADLEREFPDWSSEKIENKVGIRQRHVVNDNETALDLALKACEELLKNYDKNRIDFVILCTQSPEYYLPTGACILQDKLGLRTDVGAFDYNLGCSGFIYGLALAKSLILSNIAASILLVTAETYTRHIHHRDRANRTIFGDAAAATIIEKSAIEGIGEFVLGTDGSGYKDLIIPNGGLRNKYDINAEEINNGLDGIRTNNHLYMNGPEIFNFTIRIVPRLVSEILEKNKTTLSDIDYVIFHQANSYMLEYLRKKINIPRDKFYVDLLFTGNTVSSTIPIAIKNCLYSNIISKGDSILIVGFGVGYSWGGTIIKV